MTVIDDHLDTDTWWQNIYSGDTLTAPLHQVIDGLDEIAAQPIPYNWLPGRARTFYGADFTTFGDLALMQDRTHLSGGVWVRLRNVLLHPIEAALAAG